MIEYYLFSKALTNDVYIKRLNIQPKDHPHSGNRLYFFTPHVADCIFYIYKRDKKEFDKLFAQRNIEQCTLAETRKGSIMKIFELHTKRMFRNWWSDVDECITEWFMYLFITRVEKALDNPSNWSNDTSNGAWS